MEEGGDGFDGDSGVVDGVCFDGDEEVSAVQDEEQFDDYDELYKDVNVRWFPPEPLYERGGADGIQRENEMRNVLLPPPPPVFPPEKVQIPRIVLKEPETERAISTSSGHLDEPAAGARVPPQPSQVSDNLGQTSGSGGGNVNGGGGSGMTALFVGELHWWTTDAELEAELCKYGKVKEVRFFKQNRSGRSNGRCLVEFYEPMAAAACKNGMNGHIFNGRPCVVTSATPWRNQNPWMAQSQQPPALAKMRRGVGGAPMGGNYSRGGRMGNRWLPMGGRGIMGNSRIITPPSPMLQEDAGSDQQYGEEIHK